jgi:hypothetical protein
MDIIKVTAPGSGEIKEFSVSPQMHEGKQAWCLSLEDGKEELIGLDEHDVWMQLTGSSLDPKLVSEIGKIIEGKATNSSR